ncbi:MAG: hypothetical protein ACYDIA_05770 [Candidatus Humimicrobiaceae bacterium]
MKILPDWINEIKSTLPELPGAREKRYKNSLGLSDYDYVVDVIEKRRESSLTWLKTKILTANKL